MFGDDLFTSTPVNGSTGSVVLDYNYPVEDLPRMQQLFDSWGLKCVYQAVLVEKLL